MIEKLKSIYLFEKFSQENLDKLVSISKVKHYSKGSIVFFAGDLANSLHILVSGEAQVYKNDNRLNKIILHNFKAPTLIAEVANLEKIPFPASCEASCDCEFVLIDYKDFEEKFLKDPAISIQIIKSLTKKIKHLENVIENNIVLDATARVAKYIYENHEKFKNTKNNQIANALNIKPETFSRVLKKFKDDEIIDKNNNIIKHKELRAFYIDE